MGLEEEIFEELFKKLELEKKIPDEVLFDLKKRYENESLDSKQKFLKMIRLVDTDEN